MLFLALLACADPAPADGAAAPPAAPPPAAPPAGAPKELVIPADDPRWSTMTGLLDHPGLYGEASWDDVRMRVIGHVAAVGRDRARLRAGRGDFAGCAAAYRALAARIDAIPSATPTGAPIRATLRDAATRDAALCDALARREAPPVPAGTIPPLRARWHALAQRVNVDTPPSEAWTAEARALAEDARRAEADAGRRAADLSLDRFADFEARHALRVALVEAYADAVDPLHVSEPWGYWEPTELARPAAAIAGSAEAGVSGNPTRPGHPGFVADPRVLLPARDPLRFTAEALGALPTGDSYVDVAGFPGPRAIGTLAKLSLDDPAHRAWLDAKAAALNELPDREVPNAVAALVAELDRHPWGSRYYNVKQARNTAVRVLASRGAYAEARTVLAASWPLHAQDWACPDRGAILRGIEARLLVAAGDSAADAALDAADAEIDAFLAHVAAAEARGPAGPPQGPPNPQGPPRGPPNPQGPPPPGR